MTHPRTQRPDTRDRRCPVAAQGSVLDGREGEMTWQVPRVAKGSAASARARATSPTVRLGDMCVFNRSARLAFWGEREKRRLISAPATPQ